MNEPAYPIFFPTYTPTQTGYSRDWWYYDPGIDADDVGPFETRAEAVSDWAINHLIHSLLEESDALDKALQKPIITPSPIPDASGLRTILESQNSLQEQGFQVVKDLMLMEARD